MMRPRVVSLLPLCYLVLAMNLFATGRLMEVVPVLMALRPSLLATGLAALYLILNPELLRSLPAMRFWPSRAVLFLIAIAIVGLPFTLAPGLSLSFITTAWYTVLFLWFLQIVTLRSTRELRLLEWGFVLAAGLVVYSSLFQTGMTSQYGSLVARLDDTRAAMYDPNDLCVPLMMAMPLSVHLFQTSRLAGKIASALLLIGSGWAVALSGSRGGFLGLLAVGLGLLFAAKGVSVSKRLLTLVGIAGALVLAAPDGYWQQMKTIFAPEEDYNWTAHSGRRAIWTRGLGYIAQYPVFGLGLSNFQTAECTISPLIKRADPNGEPIICAAPHNSFLQVGAELGLPGLVAWCAIVFGSMVAPRRLRKRLPAHWSRGDPDERFLYGLTVYLPLASLGFACTAFFVSFAYMDMVYTLAAMTAGLYVAVRRKLAQQWTYPQPAPQLVVGGRRTLPHTR